jgi:proteasome lid subunit RPN8/RPN11
MISKRIKQEIIDHADECAPRECCGLVVIKKGKRQYIKCRNIADNGNDFAIHPEDYADAEDSGKIVMVVHSHPRSNPLPSDADLIGCEQSGVEWAIIAGITKEIHTFKPSGYVQPLLGREFVHGVLDCYSFIYDYYDQVLGIKLPQYERKHNWWLEGQNLYLDNFEAAGFYEVDDLQYGDMILMKVGSPVPNHGAVYIGDGKIEHHQTMRLSSRDVYGGWYQKITSHIMRHKEMKQ